MSLILTLVSTVLHSLSFPPLLGGEGTVKKAELVRLFYKLDWPARTKNIQEVESAFDNQVSSAVEVVKISNLISNSPSLALHWLQSMTSLSHTQLSRILPRLSSLFLCFTSTAVAKLSLVLILRCVVKEDSLSSMVLTMLLHKLVCKGSM